LQPRLNHRLLKSLNLFFGQTLSSIDADLTALEAKLAKLRAIKQGMMQELLTGRIRLL